MVSASNFHASIRRVSRWIAVLTGFALRLLGCAHRTLLVTTPGVSLPKLAKTGVSVEKLSAWTELVRAGEVL